VRRHARERLGRYAVEQDTARITRLRAAEVRLVHVRAAKMTELCRPEMRPRLNGRLIKCAVVLFATVLTVVLVEILLRVLIPPFNAKLYTYSADSARFKLLKANHTDVAYGVPFRTNKLGFRDQNEDVRSKAPDEFRVIVLGDSFIMCAGVPFDKLSTSLARHKLEYTARGGRKLTVNVFNLAAGGYNPIQYCATLKELGLSLHPDAIVLALYVPNDFEMNDYENARDVAAGRHQNAQVGFWGRLYINLAFGPQLRRIWKGLTSWTHSLSKHSLSRRSGGEDIPCAGNGRWLVGSDGWNRNVAALVEISEIAQKHSIPFGVVLLPHTSDFKKQQEPHEIVARMCETNHIAFIDVLPVLIGKGRSPLAYRLNLIDSHPNAAYNEIVADKIVELVQKTSTWRAYVQQTAPLKDTMGTDLTTSVLR
jgi:hypothetical protein